MLHIMSSRVLFFSQNGARAPQRPHCALKDRQLVRPVHDGHELQSWSMLPTHFSICASQTKSISNSFKKSGLTLR